MDAAVDRAVEAAVEWAVERAVEAAVEWEAVPFGPEPSHLVQRLSPRHGASDPAI